MAKLSMNDIVNIVVNLSPRSAARKGFNLGLIMGKSNIIPAKERVRLYNSLSAMAEDGFTEQMPEYKAASLYFQQSKRPVALAVGRYDKDSETAAEAINDCREKNTDWYAVTLTEAEPDEILTLSEYIESAVPASVFAFTDSTALDEPDEEDESADSSLFATLKALSRRRTMGQFSRTADAVAAILGYAMGANTRTANSVYTLMHKTEVGVIPDSLSASDVSKLQKLNANYYVSRGPDDAYSMFENGVMCDGTYFDEMINLDILVNDMQLAVLDLMKSRNKIPHTEGGMNDIKLALKPCLERMRQTGFIAPGLWNGPDIWLADDYLGLATGDMLPEGFMILSEPVSRQSQADRDARMAPPIYTPIKLAGAIHTVLVQIDVNR